MPREMPRKVQRERCAWTGAVHLGDALREVTHHVVHLRDHRFAAEVSRQSRLGLLGGTNSSLQSIAIKACIAG